MKAIDSSKALEEINPSRINNLVYAIGAIELLGSLLVLAGPKLGAFLLISVTAPVTAILQNPLLSHFTKQERALEYGQTLTNLLLIGILIMVAGYSGYEVAENRCSNQFYLLA